MTGRGGEHDLPVLGTDRVRLDHARGVDDRVHHLARRGGSQLDASAVRLQLALVGDERFQRLPGRDVLHMARDLVADAKLHELVAVEVEVERVAGGEGDRAERRRDGAGVAHARCDQRGEAAVRRRDGAHVDDRGVGPAGDVEVEAPRNEVLVADVARCGEEARRGDHRAGAEDDAVGVDHEDLAVRVERAEDLARALLADDAVQRDRVRARLDEGGLLADADIEQIPVDDRLVAELIDGDVGGDLTVDLRRAADHHAAVRASERGRDRHQGRRGQQEIAEASHQDLRQYFAPRMMKPRTSSRGPCSALATERSTL